MSVPTRLVVAAVLAIAVPLAASQAPVQVRLATQAPTNSTWHKALGELGATWSKITNGRVTLQSFPDGRLGDERVVVQRLRGDVGSNLQAALLTAGGLANIDDAFNVFGMPFFVENDAEQLAVQRKLEPRLQEILEAKGVHLISWGTGGWVELFSKQPIRTLAELKASKLYTGRGEDRLLQWYTKNGFNAIQLSLAEITTQLKLPSGQINAAPNTPYLAMMTQIFTPAPYMLDLHIAPLVGALVVSTKTWNSISADDRAKLTEAARAMEARIRTEIPALDASSLAEMTKKGLQVVKLTPAAAAEFRAAATDMVKTMRGGMVPAEIFDMALAERDAFRKTNKLAASQAPVEVRLATQAPTNSTWHKALGELGATGAKVTNGRVTLQSFADGQLGDEQTVVRRLRGDLGSNLQAALLTAGGLANIDDAFNVFGMPLFIENDAEQQAVQKKLEPRLQEILEAKGIHLVAWGTGGWVELFSKQPIRTLAELKASKLYTGRGEDRLRQWYTRNGFNAIPLTLAEITTQLKLPSGQINAAPNTPYLALMTQIFTPAPHMLNLHITPLVGALVVSTRTWNSISADDRAKLTEAARAMETRIRTEIPALDAASMAEMTKKGLKVVKLAPAAAAEFRAAAADMVKTMRGGMVPAEIFDMALAERDAFRKGKK